MSPQRILIKVANSDHVETGGLKSCAISPASLAGVGRAPDE